jgi:TolB-like protein/Tfp pilus assembly protein PilF
LFRFAGFTLDLSRAALLDAAGQQVPLRPKSFDVLRHLLENPGRLVSREELLEAIWAGVFVADDNVTGCIAEIRRAVGERGPMLRTIPKRGYLLEAEVTRSAEHRGEIRGSEKPSAVEKHAAGDGPTRLLPPSDRPSLVVLPFTNLSGDPEQEYFADGMTEELTTALIQLRWFFVIARNSAFTYKGRAVDVRQVGRELGVRYILEGSIRRSGKRVRISAQLVDAVSGGHIWADRFDRDLIDVFELQDCVTRSVASAIEPSLRRAEIDRARYKPTDSLDAYDLYLRALPNFYGITQEGTEEALRLLQRAVEMDPEYARAKAFVAMFHGWRFTCWWGDDATETEASIRLAREALHGGQEDAEALRAAGWAISYVGREHDVGVAALDRALLLSGGGSAPVLSISGQVNYYAGNWRKAIEHFHQAIRLSPIDPELAKFYMGLSNAHFHGQQYEEAVDWARRALQLRPRDPVSHRLLVTSLANAGRVEEARAACRTLLEVLPPRYSIASNRTRLASRNTESVERFLDGLRIAGVRE